MSSSTAVAATVSFTPLAAGSAYEIKTASFAWPASSAQQLRALRITKVNGIGVNFAGAFDIKKAYLKIIQNGVIRKTVSRLPIAVKQTGITSAGWVDLADIAYYKHLAGDFDAATTVALRTTGIETTANLILHSLHVRLVDASGTEVSGSENVHEGLASLQSSSLNLVDGETYRLQARVTTLPQSGDLYSADLVFEQSSTDADGLRCAVPWRGSQA